MRLKPKHILVAATLLLIAPSAFRVTAQESSFPTLDNVEAEKEKNQYVPSPESEKPSTRQSRDSVVVKPAATRAKTNDALKSGEKTAPETKNGGEDSVLSFNFLYYFIQKFKMSDIVDQ